MITSRNENGGTVELRPGTVKLAVGLVLVAFLVLACAQAFTRAPYNDEAFNASAGVTLARSGYLGLTFVDQWGTGKRLYSMPPGYLVFQGLVFKLAGVSVFTARVGNVFWALVLIGSVMVIMWKFSGRREIALLAGGLLALDYTFLMNINGRPEMMSAGLGLGSLACYLWLRETRLGWAVLASQACLAVSFMAHPIGAATGGLYLVAFSAWLDLRRLRMVHLAIAVIPYVVVFVPWLLYIAQAPDMFVEQWKHINAVGDRVTLRHPLDAVWSEIRVRFLGYYGVRKQVTPAILAKLILPIGYLLALLLCVATPKLRRDGTVRRVGVLLGICWLVLTYLEGTRQFHYLLHEVPLLVCLVACAVWYLLSNPKVPKWLAGAVMVLLVGVQVLPVLYRVRLDTYHNDYIPAIRVIERYRRPGGRIVASSEMCFHLGFTDEVQLDYTMGYADGKAPDIVATEPTVDEHIEVQKVKNPPAYAQARKTLDEECQLMHDARGYRVWVRKSLLAATGR